MDYSTATDNRRESRSFLHLRSLVHQRSQPHETLQGICAHSSRSKCHMSHRFGQSVSCGVRVLLCLTGWPARLIGAWRRCEQREHQKRSSEETRRGTVLKGWRSLLMMPTVTFIIERPVKSCSWRRKWTCRFASTSCTDECRCIDDRRRRTVDMSVI